ncbi:thiamine phosphate synthase [Polaribacter sp. 20A6]|uniref:thiamine phosphate synthase n=1 Tax=Polaribacter sp. 20A6 TaxID=2687289 RepID=UPI0013FE0EA3|nr:thiamine phosphate synthase [Polaribacter sp. 20A6]
MIPKLHYISQGNSLKEHLENIQKACSSGAELVQLKIAGISEKKYLKLALEAREITSHFQTRLILSNHFKIAKEVKADGVHLEDIDFCATTALEHLYTWQIVGATANTLQDCNALISKKVDYITLSPFKDKETKENSTKDLGLNGFSLIVEALKTETPIIGAGGITTDDVAAILETGVSGIAVSDAISQNFDSIKKFNELLNASSTQEQRHTF